MKKILYIGGCLLLACSWVACDKTESYAELVANEKEAISTWISRDPLKTDFGHISSKNEEWVKNVAEDILVDSLHPEQCGIELGKWYRITEGDFKRLYFRINDWGNDGLNDLREKGITPTDEQYLTAMRNRKKFYVGKNVLVRYDDQYIISEYDYDDAANNVGRNNLDPVDWLKCYSWNTGYYATNYYSYYASSKASDECTSGGIAFPIRFLWDDGNASIICPFSLAESSFAGYYYTFYYGDIKYNRPNY